MPSSYTTTLPDDILIDTAILKADITTVGVMEAVGASRGGLTWNPGKEMREVEYDGRRAPVVALDRISFMRPTITGTMIQFGAKQLRMMEAGSSGTLLEVTPKLAGVMFVIGDYHKFELVYSRGNGGTLTIGLAYGLVKEYSIGGTDNNEAEAPITIEARQRRDDALSSDGEVPYTYLLTDPV